MCRACFHHINIFFLGVLFGLQKSKVSLDRVYQCKIDSGSEYVGLKNRQENELKYTRKARMMD